MTKLAISVLRAAPSRLSSSVRTTFTVAEPVSPAGVKVSVPSGAMAGGARKSASLSVPVSKLSACSAVLSPSSMPVAQFATVWGAVTPPPTPTSSPGVKRGGSLALVTTRRTGFSSSRMPSAARTRTE